MKILKQSALMVMAIFIICAPAFGQGKLLIPDIEGKIMGTLIAPANYTCQTLVADGFKRLAVNMSIAGIAGIRGKFSPNIKYLSLPDFPKSVFTSYEIDRAFPKEAFDDRIIVPGTIGELQGVIISEVQKALALITDPSQAGIFPILMGPAEKTGFYAAVITTLFKTRSFMLRQALKNSSSSGPGHMRLGQAKLGTVDRRPLEAYMLMTWMLDAALDPQKHYDDAAVGASAKSSSLADMARYDVEHYNTRVRVMVLEGKNTVASSIRERFHSAQLDIISLFESQGKEIAPEQRAMLQEIYESFIAQAQKYGYLTEGIMMPETVEEFVASMQ